MIFKFVKIRHHELLSTITVSEDGRMMSGHIFGHIFDSAFHNTIPIISKWDINFAVSAFSTREALWYTITHMNFFKNRCGSACTARLTLPPFNKEVPRANSIKHECVSRSMMTKPHDCQRRVKFMILPHGWLVLRDRLERYFAIIRECIYPWVWYAMWAHGMHSNEDSSDRDDQHIHVKVIMSIINEESNQSSNAITGLCTDAPWMKRLIGKTSISTGSYLSRGHLSKQIFISWVLLAMR